MGRIGILIAAAFAASLAGGASARPAQAAEDSVAADSERSTPETAGGGWRFGRTPAVFQDGEATLATRLGGWVDGSYQDNDRRGVSPSLSINHLNLYADTRWRHWQLFLEGEYEHEDDRSGYEGERELELEQGYLKFAPDERASLRAGRFNTPFGYWIPIHWEILMDTIEKPLFVGREMIPEQQIGAELAGRWYDEELARVETELSYSMYVGYGSEGLAQDNVDGFAGGGDLRLRLDEHYLIGTSFYRGRNREFDDRTETSYLAYTDLALPYSLHVRSEYLHQRRERVAGASWERDIDVLYAKLRWHFLDNAYLNYRYTYGDDDEEGETSETSIHTLTLGIQPRSGLRFKLELSDHRFRDSAREDFLFWGVSLGALF